MRFVSVVLTLGVVAMANASGNLEKPHYDVSNAHSLFEDFMKTHNRQYKDDADKEVHFQAFAKNLEKMNKLNEQNPTASFAINKFADYTEEERQGMFGLRSE